MELPVGYRFKPFEDELVKYYLLARVTGNPMPWNPIIECDLYDVKTPGEIFDEPSNQKVWYCFTRLKKRGKRVFRRAGGGTWHGQSSAFKILDRDNNFQVIGEKKTFTFDMKNEVKKCNKWIMHEFSLVGEYGGCDVVLCKIKKEALKDDGSVSQTCWQEQEDGVLIANTNNNNQVEEALQNMEAFLMNDNEKAMQRDGRLLMNGTEEAMQRDARLLMNEYLQLITDGGIRTNDGVDKASDNNADAVQYNSGFSQSLMVDS
ncbi:NAC domain-containing protein 30-like [Pistacia vera]|uniref:NAC domain-containing protein 30-like n=1 Tax=Pistacia vera TaxID=55513 RepID=UPI001263404D|nr:NAC domain-containing protein 30-like [Pistacia vera]